MSTMDLKGITWVGHVYQKFESMCLEVEEIMYQDTVKFVENQVQTVGANVKRFYSDVMQDLTEPSSMDPVKVAASDLPVEQYTDNGMYKMPKVGMKEEAGKVDVWRITEDSKQIANLGRDAGHEPSVNGLCHVDSLFQPSSGNSISGAWSDLYSRQYNDGNMHGKTNRHVKEIHKKGKLLPTGMSREITPIDKDLSRVSTFSELSNKKHQALGDQIAVTSGSISVEFTGHDSVDESFNEIENASEGISDALTDGPSYDMIIMAESIGNKEMEMRLSSDGLSAESNAADMCTNEGIVSVAESSMDRDIQHNKFSDTVIFVSNPGLSDDWSLDMIESSTVIVPDMEIIQEFDPVEVEETCVMVNGAELQFVPHKEGKRKPYKKKIRDAISSRMRSARKQEYEHLAVSCGDDGKSNQKCVVHSPGLIIEDAKRSPTHDTCESEWELL